MEKAQSKNQYIYIVLAVIALVAMIAWAFFTGRRDGAQHKINQSNQSVNQTP